MTRDSKQIMKTKIQEFEVLVPNVEGTEVAERVKVQIPVQYDEELGEWILTPEAHEIIDGTKARHMGLLLPEQFKALRKKLGFSQREMGELFQVGEKSWTRWESGNQRPSRSISLLIKAVHDGEISVNYLLKQAGKEPVAETQAEVNPWIGMLYNQYVVAASSTCRVRRDTAETVMRGIQTRKGKSEVQASAHAYFTDCREQTEAFMWIQRECRPQLAEVS